MREYNLPGRGTTLNGRAKGETMLLKATRGGFKEWKYLIWGSRTVEEKWKGGCLGKKVGV